MLTNKQLADELQVTVYTLMQWSHTTGVKPSIRIHRCHRWTRTQADKLVSALANLKPYQKKKCPSKSTRPN